MPSYPFDFSYILISITVVMTLRVYAMWRRSRTILIILLLIYIPGVAMTFVTLGIYFTSNTHFSGMSFIQLVSSNSNMQSPILRTLLQ